MVRDDDDDDDDNDDDDDIDDDNADRIVERPCYVINGIERERQAISISISIPVCWLLGFGYPVTL